jgi:hypothetical protein
MPAIPPTTDRGSASARDCAFYLIADSRFFIGAVVVLNSLRLIGHQEPIVVVDAGLTAAERSALSTHAELISAPENVSPALMKMTGPLTRPADVAVVLDSDVIVVSPLNDLIDAAASGQLVAFVNNAPVHDRFFPEWSTVLELTPMRRQPYLAAGQLFIPRTLNDRLFTPWQQGQAKVDMQRTLWGRGRLTDPFYFADMDVFNAVVSNRLEPNEILMLENRYAPVPPFPELELIDPERLLVRYPNGEHPYLLHHILGKPWLKATRTNIFTLLLPRLLLAPDLPLRLTRAQIPLRLRDGWLPAIDRRRAHTQAVLYEEGRHQLGRFGIRTRIRAWRQARHTSRNQELSAPTD